MFTGIIAALISAPIAAGVFGGVTGSGTDFLVAAFRQAGADIDAATLGQGLISDPIDKVTTFFVVYLILPAMATALKARFPQGERSCRWTRPRRGGWRERPPERLRPISAGLPRFSAVPAPAAFHRLNPLTKLALATVTALAAILVGGRGTADAADGGCPGPGDAGRCRWAGCVRTALLLSLPIAISVLLVNLFFFPGGPEVLLRSARSPPPPKGLRFALETLARIAAISGAITLFYLTTPPSDLVLDLERRGVAPRLAFVANASVQTVPAMVERAGAITAAQRARGLDTEGSIWKRIRGVLPWPGPVLAGLDRRDRGADHGAGGARLHAAGTADAALAPARLRLGRPLPAGCCWPLAR